MNMGNCKSDKTVLATGKVTFIILSMLFMVNDNDLIAYEWL